MEASKMINSHMCRVHKRYYETWLRDDGTCGAGGCRLWALFTRAPLKYLPGCLPGSTERTVLGAHTKSDSAMSGQMSAHT
jgi:hypothetical protein